MLVASIEYPESILLSLRKASNITPKGAAGRSRDGRPIPRPGLFFRRTCWSPRAAFSLALEMAVQAAGPNNNRQDQSSGKTDQDGSCRAAHDWLRWQAGGTADRSPDKKGDSALTQKPRRRDAAGAFFVSKWSALSRHQVIPAMERKSFQIISSFGRATVMIRDRLLICISTHKLPPMYSTHWFVCRTRLDLGKGKLP
jgi:hypothetical protein